MKKKMMITMIACLGVVHLASAQKAAIKTNLLYDATTTFNLGAEFALSPKWTLDVSGRMKGRVPRDEGCKTAVLRTSHYSGTYVSL